VERGTSDEFTTGFRQDRGYFTPRDIAQPCVDLEFIRYVAAQEQQVFFGEGIRKREHAFAI
jgi:hypothetical protein